MNHQFINVFFMLIASHYFGDYVFQGEPMAKGKNHRQNKDGHVPWYVWLSAHAAVHATLVGVVLGAWYWALAEYCLHWLIDYRKCDGRLSFHRDQQLHLLCKLAYFAVWGYLQVTL
jgi:hypothetical protein